MELLQAFNQLLQKRFSPRAFSEKKISKEILFEVLDAARQGPSCFNEQPWRFVYAFKEDKENYQRLLSCLVEKNQQWAKEAPVLMLAVAKKTFSANDRPNRHAWYDTGAAVGIMTLKATALDVFFHQMAGFDAFKASEVLQIPGEYEPVVMIAMGYLDEERKPDKPRRPLEEIAFTGGWND